MARLTARFWVDAYLARLRMLEIPAFVVAHGDDTAGSVLVKLNTLDGAATLFQRSFDLMEDRWVWTIAEKGAEAEMDALIARQLARDSDMWVIEVEDRLGRHMLDQPEMS